MTELSLAVLFDAIAAAVPERECIVHRDRRFTYSQTRERSARLASHLGEHGLGAHRERSQLQGWESGQDHVALYMYNRPEYLEAMLGCWKARASAFNVNYRYVDAELIDLLNDAQARAIVYDSAFAQTVERIRAQVPSLRFFIQLSDPAEDAALLPGAIEYEAALAASDPARPNPESSPDDLYVLYTGGTTGKPKGVLWRQTDIFFAALGGTNAKGEEASSLEAIVERARRPPARVLPSPPMMHGAAHWVAFNTLHGGGTVVIQDHPQRFDAADVLTVVERERVQRLVVVGDAFARPLFDELTLDRHDASSLQLLLNGGAALTADMKRALMLRLPQLSIVDTIGSSESGQQGTHVSEQGRAQTGRFAPARRSCVLSADRSRVLAAGDAEIGWLAQRGRVPLGYLGDAEKTERAFPIIEGVRYSIPGDRARLLENGELEVLGRDSVTINSGGEKIFAEEVEAALKQHCAVYDVLVCGRASERWGQEVCAVVQLRGDASATAAELIAAATPHLARYKLPKHIVFRDRIERSPAGKPDYRWAREQVEKG